MNPRGLFFKDDCLHLLSGLKSNSIDLVFTDPPFNLGKDYADPLVNDKIDHVDYIKWCQTWLSELIRVLKPGGTLCIYLLPKWAMDLGAWLNLRDDLIYRSIIGLKMKSGFPIRGRLHPALYNILYYAKAGAKPTFNVVRYKAPTCRFCKKEIRDYGGYRKKFNKFEDDNGVPWIQISDLWEDTRPARQDKTRNNTINELPLHIPERIILMASNENDVVLDIFGGGGSTFHAAQMHGRLWIGCDKANPEPCLARFATIWGRDEVDKPNHEIAKCFEETFLLDAIKEKKERAIYPIRAVDALTNGHSLLKKDVVSKSKVLGF